MQFFNSKIRVSRPHIVYFQRLSNWVVSLINVVKFNENYAQVNVKAVIMIFKFYLDPGFMCHILYTTGCLFCM